MREVERPRFHAGLICAYHSLDFYPVWPAKATRTQGWDERKLLYCFENLVLDTELRELRRAADLISLQPQVFDLLEYLIRNRERVVSKDDLIGDIWGGRIVSESALTTRINAARSAIGDNGAEQRLIKTLPRKGIRFMAAVREQQSVMPSARGERPSIAVMPFTNLGEDATQEYFADGVAEDLIAGLSRVRWLRVIARSSSFSYRGKQVDPKQVSRDLGVWYVVDGSVRRAGDAIRISIELVDAPAGIQIWSAHYRRELKDIFAVQVVCRLSDTWAGKSGAAQPSA
jgi:TolB-like protein